MQKSVTPKGIHEDMVQILDEDSSSYVSKKEWAVELKQARITQKILIFLLKDPNDITTIFTSGSTICRYLCVKPPTEFNMIKNCVYAIPCSCGKVYKGGTCCPLKIRLEEYWKAVPQGEIEKLGMVDHIWKEKGNHLLLWDEIKIIYRDEHWRIRCFKESVHMYVG